MYGFGQPFSSVVHDAHACGYVRVRVGAAGFGHETAGSVQCMPLCSTSCLCTLINNDPLILILKKMILAK